MRHIVHVQLLLQLSHTVNQTAPNSIDPFSRGSMPCGSCDNMVKARPDLLPTGGQMLCRLKIEVLRKEIRGIHFLKYASPICQLDSFAAGKLASRYLIVKN